LINRCINSLPRAKEPRIKRSRRHPDLIVCIVNLSNLRVIRRASEYSFVPRQTISPNEAWVLEPLVSVWNAGDEVSKSNSGEVHLERCSPIVPV
jgi:hypothetical protein